MVHYIKKRVHTATGMRNMYFRVNVNGKKTITSKARYNAFHGIGSKKRVTKRRGTKRRTIRQRGGGKSCGAKPAKYRNVPDSMFCGSAAGECRYKYPVNTPGRRRAAKSYGSRFAKNYAGLLRCIERHS